MQDKDIVAAYKRAGHFDEKRRALFDAFCADTERREQLLSLVERLVKCKIQKDPDVFAKNSGKLSSLIQTELVKRYAVTERERERDKSKAGRVVAVPLPPQDHDATETELLDAMNALLDSYAASTAPVSVETLSGLTVPP